jgi:hypothetical protein
VAKVHLEESDCLVVLSKDSRDPNLMMTVDSARVLKDALIAGAEAIEHYMETSGKLIAPAKVLTEIWEAKVGYFSGGVVIQFNQSGTRVPLPPAVAKHLADRVQSAINAAETGTTIRVHDKEPHREFGARPKLQ